MATTLTVAVDDGTGTFVEVAADLARVKRRVGPGLADFRIPVATTSDRQLCQPGSEAHVTLQVGDTAIIFGGYVGKPRVTVSSSRVFSLMVEVVPLNYGASLKPVFLEEFPNPNTKYTDMLGVLWDSYWTEVQRAGLQDDPRTHPDPLNFEYTDLAKATERICRQMLGDYVWWVEWTGTGSDKLLKAGTYDYELTGKTIGELDILNSYELSPTQWDYRNLVHVVGGDGGGPDPSDPEGGELEPENVIVGRYPPTNPDPLRPIVIHDKNVVTPGAATQRAQGEWWSRRLKYEGRFGVRDFELDPGHVLTLDLPTIGVNSAPYAVRETEDRYERGKVTRTIVVQEVL